MGSGGSSEAADFEVGSVGAGRDVNELDAVVVVDDGAGDDETDEAGASTVGPGAEHPETAKTVSAAQIAPGTAG